MHFSRKSKETCKRAKNFESQQVVYFLQLTDLITNHFHGSYYLTIKQKPELRLNGMVTPAIMDLWIFHSLLIWYDRAWQFISKSMISSYELHSFFRYLILKLEKLKQPVTKYVEITPF